LKKVDPQLVPPTIMARLDEHFRFNARHNFRLLDELLTILKLFESNGIEVAPFKGPTLAILVYGNLGFREFSDLDILVRPDNVIKAKNLLCSIGYQPEIQLAGARLEHFIQSQHELLFRREADGNMVELHWKIDSKYFSFSLNVQDVWMRLKPVTIAGTTVMTLAREDLLLYLCAHGAKHLWERLEWICGVAELVREAGRLDWTVLLKRATKLKGERTLFLGLLLANDLLEASLPPRVLQEAHSDEVVTSLASWVRERLFDKRLHEAGPIECAIFYFKLNRRKRDGLMYGLRYALTPTVADIGKWELPRVLSPFYLLFRPIRVVQKYGWRS
jgi:hypothetical protein